MNPDRDAMPTPTIYLCSCRRHCSRQRQPDDVALFALGIGLGLVIATLGFLLTAV